MRSLQQQVVGIVVAGFALGGACVCEAPVPDAPELRVRGTGVFVGEVFDEVGSIAGATVEVIGTAARVTSAQDKQFSLYPIPLGDRTVAIHDTAGRAARFKAKMPTANATIPLDVADTTLGDPVTISGTVSLEGGGADDARGAVVFIVGGTGDEIVTAGDGGAFTLRNVPPGDRVVGASFPGHDLATVEVTAAAGEELAGVDLELVELGDVEPIALRGTAQLVGTNDHAGVIVTLDDGSAITGTDEDGRYSFDVLPGVHRVRAERAGFASVELLTISVTAAGQVGGLEAIFLAPAQQTAPGIVSALVIDAPLYGTTVASGAPVLLSARIDNPPQDGSLTDQMVAWSWAYADDATETYTSLGLGRGLTPSFAEGAERDIIIRATVPNTPLVDESLITVQPVFSARPSAGVTVLDVAFDTQLADADGDGDFDLSVGEGIPVEIGASAASGLAVLWQSDTDISFTNALKLGELPRGAHLFTASVVNEEGLLEESARVDVDVHDVVFTVTTQEPRPDTVYYTTSALPLGASVSHEWQLAFANNAVSWAAPDGTVLLDRLNGDTTAAPAGAQFARLTVTDLAGHVRTVNAPYELQPVTFTAAIDSPLQDFTADLGEPIPFRVSFEHTLVPANDPDVRVTLSSSRDGLVLVDDGSGSQVAEFAPNTTVTVTSLSAGEHTITARVETGDGGLAVASVTVVVNASFVTALRTKPAASLLLAIPGTPMDFAVAVVPAPGEQANVSWFLDGVEFAPSWGGYGTNPLAPARRDLALGAYDPEQAPFNDARWSAGDHVVSAWVRLQGVDDQGVTQCQSIGAVSKCLSVTVRVFDDLEPKGTQTISDLQVWGGAILLTGEVAIVAPGTLVIQPGTTIIVDGNAGSSAERALRFRGGALIIGDDDAPPVTFGLREGGTISQWGGILTENVGAAVQVLDVRNTILRDAVTGFDLNGISPLDASHTFHIADVTIEDVGDGVRAPCPSDPVERGIEGLVVRRAGFAGLVLSEPPSCPATTHTVPGALIEDVAYGVYIALGASSGWVLSGFDVRRAAANGIAASVSADVSVTLSSVTDSETAVGVSAPGHTIRVQDSLFSGNVVAVATADAVLIDVARSSFDDNGTALSLTPSPARDVHVHGNAFENNGVDVAYTGALGNRAHAEGNDFGDPLDPSTHAGFLAANAPGAFPSSPFVTDAIDQAPGDAYIVLVDNPYRGAAPLAIIEQPRRAEPYHPDLCLPLEAHAVADGYDASACTWAADGTPLTVAADGCADQALGDGVHAITLTCPAGDGTNTVHATSILVDSTRYAGRLRASGLTLSGTVLVDGDLTVPAGATLTLTAGTTLRLDLQGDRLAHAAMTALDPSRLGSADLVDIFVAGTLLAQGSSGAHVTLQPTAGSAMRSWGDIVALRESTVSLTFTDVVGPTSVVRSEVIPGAPFSHADVALDQVAITEAANVLRGACGTSLVDVDLVGYERVTACDAHADVVVTRLTASNQRLPSAGVFTVAGTVLGAQPASLTVEDSTVGAFGSGLVDFFSAQSITITGSTFDGVSGLGQPGFAQITFADNNVSNFSTFITVNAHNQSVVVDHCVFDTGTAVAGSTVGLLQFTNNRVKNVLAGLNPLESSQILLLEMTGNLFEANVGVAVRVAPGGGGSVTPVFDLSGNDFSGAAVVFELFSGFLSGGDPNLVTVNIDATDSYFGPGFTDAASIEATKIIDARTDASAGDNIEGRTDYSGFLSSPPTLDVP